MKEYSPLHIPLRDRKKGQHIWCGYCNTTITDVCKDTGKKKHTCKHASSHRFQSKTWDPSKKRTVPVMTYPKELRDFKEFDRLHPIEVQKYFERRQATNDVKARRPSNLKNALQKFYDWLQDIDVPSHKRKNYDKKYLQNELRNILDFKDCLPGFDFLLVRDVNDEHVALFHDFLTERFSNKTYNNKMHTMRNAFKYFIKIGYPIKNPFEEIKSKSTKAKKNFIELEDFRKLMQVTTKENGIAFEKSNGEIKRKSLYRDWLTDFWELALYTGGRREDVAELKLSHVKAEYVEVYDFKNSDQGQKDVIRWVARSKEFNELLGKLTTKYKLKGDDYLIEPSDDRRTTIMNHASKAFTHYWRQLDTGYYARMYSLRDTHITLMIMRYGNLYEGVFGTHSNIQASLENYASYEKMIAQFSGKSMLG